MSKTWIFSPAFTFSVICLLLYAGEASAAQTGEISPAQRAVRRILLKGSKTDARGMKQIGPIRSGTLGPRERTEVAVELNGPYCYRFIAQGGKGINDLNLSVIDQRQREIAADRISGKRPIAQWCPSAPVKVTVTVRTYDGAGAWALGVFGAKALQSRVNRVGGPDADFVANRVRQLHAQFGQGRAAVSPLLRGTLDAGQAQRFGIRLLAGRCYTVIGAGSPSIRDLSLRLLDAGGKELKRDTTKNSFPTLDTQPCIKTEGSYTLRVSVESGEGQFGVQVFSD